MGQDVEWGTVILLLLVLLCGVIWIESLFKKAIARARKSRAIKIDNTPDENGNCRTCGGNCGQCGWSGGGN
jgi:hypothetical protein